jgi:hypothetical protein
MSETGSESWSETITGSRPDASARHAVLRLEGDLDARATADAFIGALDDLDARAPRLILIELTGDRSRPDLLHDAVRAIMDTETETAVWLADPDDRRVGPGMLALALAADHAGVHPSTTIERAPDDDLTGLNPEIEDWAVVGLDLRSLARDLADAGPLARGVYESALAPRSSLWIISDQNGAPALSPEAPARGDAPRRAHARGLVVRDRRARRRAPLRHCAATAPARAFARTLGARTRPLETVRSRAACGTRPRAVPRTLDRPRPRGGPPRGIGARCARRAERARRGSLPHEYHDAADRAAALLAPVAEAIAEIAILTDRVRRDSCR